jgi:nucleoside-diphosphate-sugar epimerase
MSEARKILVLGASGLIGRFVTDDLRARGFQVVGVARQFSPSRNTNVLDLEMPVMSIDTGALVKTGPAIVLMLVALLTLDNR